MLALILSSTLSICGVTEEVNREERIKCLLTGEYLARSKMVAQVACCRMQGLFDQFKNRTNVP